MSKLDQLYNDWITWNKTNPHKDYPQWNVLVTEILELLCVSVITDHDSNLLVKSLEIDWITEDIGEKIGEYSKKLNWVTIYNLLHSESKTVKCFIASILYLDNINGKKTLNELAKIEDETQWYIIQLLAFTRVSKIDNYFLTLKNSENEYILRSLKWLIEYSTIPESEKNYLLDNKIADVK